MINTGCFFGCFSRFQLCSLKFIIISYIYAKYCSAIYIWVKKIQPVPDRVLSQLIIMFFFLVYHKSRPNLCRNQSHSRAWGLLSSSPASSSTSKGGRRKKLEEEWLHRRVEIKQWEHLLQTLYQHTHSSQFGRYKNKYFLRWNFEEEKKSWYMWSFSMSDETSEKICKINFSSWHNFDVERKFFYTNSGEN